MYGISARGSSEDIDMAKLNEIHFEYDEALLDYMKEKGQDTIVIELVTAENSDFEVSELYVHLSDDKIARRFIDKKRYREIKTEHGRVLFPPMKLETEETVKFRLKKVLFVKSVKCDGVSLGR